MEKRKGRAKKAVLGLVVVVVAALLTIGGYQLHTQAQADKKAEMEAQILQRENAFRENAGLTPLKLDEGLDAAADVRASESAVRFSHTRPTGQAWWTVNPDLVYGENLSTGYSSGDQIVSAWMRSAGHKENIMDAEFTTCGISVYNAGGTWYCAQTFGY